MGEQERVNGHNLNCYCLNAKCNFFGEQSVRRIGIGRGDTMATRYLGDTMARETQWHVTDILVIRLTLQTRESYSNLPDPPKK